MKPSDELLLNQIISFSDEKAFDQLFSRYYPGLLHYARVLLPYPVDEAEDIITEVFLKIWKQKSTLQVHTSIASYLYISVKNRISDYYRKNSQYSYVSLDSLIDNPCPDHIADQQLTYKELNAEINRLISKLPARTQLIFLMNRNDQLTYEDIALILSISINSVKTHMYRALKFLKEGYKASSDYL
jgi:RNA polymerase sigma-70 factor (family 1)